MRSVPKNTWQLPRIFLGPGKGRYGKVGRKVGREGGVWGWIAPVRSNVFVTVRNGFSRITSHLGVPVGDVPPIVLCQARDNVPEAQQALVDRARLLEPGALHAALEGAL